MNLHLTGKTALVCGASQGLGLASAIELALLGANVVVASRSVEKLKTAIRQLDTSKGQQHSYLLLDLSAPESVKQSVQEYLDEDNTIHILINNAGGPPAGPMTDTDAGEIEKAFRTHVISSHLLAQLLIPDMKDAGYGRIINIVSTSVKQPIHGLGLSNVVRAAVANWAKTMANELGRYGITVNNVLPGNINTERLDYVFEKQASELKIDKQIVLQNAVASIPAKRIGEPEEFGAAVAFLCSPAASYINGINLPVDGGKTGSL